MKKIIEQQENVKYLLGLVVENPELPIVPMVSIECAFSDAFSYWMAEWGNAKIDKYRCGDERMYSYNEDFDSLVEDWIDDNYEEEEYKNLEDDELQKLAEGEVEGYEWTKAIIVYIKPL